VEAHADKSSAGGPHGLNLNLSSDPDGSSPGEPQVVYSMTSVEAKEVADLLAIQLHLNFVRKACRLLQDLPAMADSGVRHTLIRALGSSALVAYIHAE
jgi:hypothetical protein